MISSSSIILIFFSFNSDKILMCSVKKNLYQLEAIFLKYVLLVILLCLLKYLGFAKFLRIAISVRSAYRGIHVDAKLNWVTLDS